MSTRGFVIPATLAISILGTAIAGGVGWGQMSTRVEGLEKEVERQGNVQEKIGEIDKAQGVLTEKIENLTREQREFRKDTKLALDRILRILPLSSLPNRR